MVALLVLGAVLVAVTAVDAFLTIMHPTRRGPVAFALSRGTFAAVRAVARALGRPSLLGPAGPLSMLAIFGGWIVLFWAGYALVYLPHTEDLFFASGVAYGDRGLFEALYFSGTALTTVGFGDVVAETDALRLVSTLEAGTGFGVITAAITFILSVYPRVSSQRVAAREVESQADDPRTAARMARGESYLVGVHQQLLEVDEDTERFPILFFFHSEDRSASLYTFFRGTMMLCLAARWGMSCDRVEHARRYGEELEQALGRSIDHYAVRFMRGHGPEALDRVLDRDDARRRLEGLVDAAGPDGDAGALEDEEELRRFAAFAGRCDEFLEHVARLHLRGHEPLLRT